MTCKGTTPGNPSRLKRGGSLEICKGIEAKGLYITRLSFCHLILLPHPPNSAKISITYLRKVGERGFVWKGLAFFPSQKMPVCLIVKVTKGLFLKTIFTD